MDLDRINDALKRIRATAHRLTSTPEENATLPLAEEIPDDKKVNGLWTCPTCKSVFACHPSARNYMRATGYCSLWCHGHHKFPIPVDPKMHIEPRKEMP